MDGVCAGAAGDGLEVGYATTLQPARGRRGRRAGLVGPLAAACRRLNSCSEHVVVRTSMDSAERRSQRVVCGGQRML